MFVAKNKPERNFCKYINCKSFDQPNIWFMHAPSTIPIEDPGRSQFNALPIQYGISEKAYRSNNNIFRDALSTQVVRWVLIIFLAISNCIILVAGARGAVLQDVFYRPFIQPSVNKICYRKSFLTIHSFTI